MNKTKEEIIVKHLDERYGELSEDVKYLKTIQFPQTAVESMMEDWADQQSSSLKAENQKLREALEELVELKDVSEKYNKTPFHLQIFAEKDVKNFQKRNPLAWEAARKLVKK